MPKRKPKRPKPTIVIKGVKARRSGVKAGKTPTRPKKRKQGAFKREKTPPIDPGTPQPPSTGRRVTPKHRRYYVAVSEPEMEVRLRKEVKRQAKINGIKDKVGKLLICKHIVQKVVQGRIISRREKSYPGYIICELFYDHDVFHLFKSARGFVCFLFDNKNPSSVESEEAARLLIEQKDVNKKLPPVKIKKFELPYAVGDLVYILEGPFIELTATVTKIEYPKVTVTLDLLGKPIEHQQRWHFFERAET